MLDYEEQRRREDNWRDFLKARMERCSNEMLKGIFHLCCVARASLGVLLGLVWGRVEQRGRVERR